MSELEATWLEYDVVDVFATDPMTGNQLAVIYGGEELSEAQLQSIAREFNFSEVTFPSKTTGSGYHMRIFTTKTELPFAGHPTLGTAWALGQRGLVAIGQEIRQHTTSGETLVRVAGNPDAPVELLAAPQTLGEPLTRAQLSALVDLIGLSADDLAGPARVAGTGLNWLHLAVRPEALDRAQLLLSPIDHIVSEHGPRGIYLYAITSADGGSVRTRSFAAMAGREDPGTGSAAAGLGMVMAANNTLAPDGRFEIEQGQLTGRPSRIGVWVNRSEQSSGVAEFAGVRSVEVSGCVRLAMSGRLAVPE